MLTMPVVTDLLEQKWKCFAERRFLAMRFTAGLVMFCFTINTIIRSEAEYAHDGAHRACCVFNPTACWPRIVELWAKVPTPTREQPLSRAALTFLWQACMWPTDAIVFACAVKKMVDKARRFYNEGSHHFFFNHAGADFLENWMCVLSASFILSARVCWFYKKYTLSHTFDAFAAVTGWAYMMFFLLGQFQTGPFIVMLYEMLARDITCFVTVYSIFLVGFGQAFFTFTVAGHAAAEGDLKRGISGFMNRIESLFESTLGDVKVSDYYQGFKYDGGWEHWVQKIASLLLFISFTILITVVLFNLLVAMMGSTYEEVKEKADQRWKLERARIIASLESEMYTKEFEEDENRYFVLINSDRYLQRQEFIGDELEPETDDEEEETKKS